MSRIKLRSLMHVAIFCLPLAIYLYNYQTHAIGADLLWRITEAKYFLARINPYDVFIGAIPVISEYGAKPAAYSFFSYFLGGLLTTIAVIDRVPILIFICIDFVALVVGIVLINRLIQTAAIAAYSQLPQTNLQNRTLMLILACSTYFWQHVYFLNYTLLSVLGLLLVLYSLSSRSLLTALIGMSLVGLRPSLAIPVFIFLAIGRHWKILTWSTLVYGFVLLITAWWLRTSPLSLLQQLSEVQRIFSDDLGYYHAKGMLLILAPYLDPYMTPLSTLITLLVVWHYRAHLTNPIVSLLLMTSCSVSLFYTQVHAWISIYPILLIALFDRSLKKSLPLVAPILIGFLIIPRLSGFVAEEFRYPYLVVQNLIRFGALWYCVIRLVNQAIVTKYVSSAAHHVSV
jgi:hypothetical protein